MAIFCGNICRQYLLAIFDFEFDDLFVPVECFGPWEVIFGGNILW